MSTEKQRMAIEKMVENGGVASRAMIDVGYSPQTAKSPHKLTKSKGFRELCDECGLTDELILNALTEDIKGKPKNRKPELELGAKIRGMLVDRSEQKIDSKNIIMWADEDTNEQNINTIHEETISEEGARESETLECDSGTQEIWQDDTSDQRGTEESNTDQKT